MHLTAPIMQGIIDRRILVNFRVQPETVRKLLPQYFRPQLVQGWAVAGICLIRLKAIRPRGFPAAYGLTSENAAHRIAVEWDENGSIREGVFIPRRDTSSRLQTFAGSRLFPGVHHLAKFSVRETNDACQLQMRSGDDLALVELSARRELRMPVGSIFKSLAEASDFFKHGSIGYSTSANPHCCDGMQLHTSRWDMELLEVHHVRSSFFDDPSRFPPGSIHFDNALLMRNIEHEWRPLPPMKKAQPKPGSPAVTQF